MLEKDVEKALTQRVKSIGGLCEKFVSPGRRSVPDRIITMPGGLIVFVEVKRPGAQPTALQAADHERRRAMGCDVRIIDTIEAAKAFKP